MACKVAYNSRVRSARCSASAWPAISSILRARASRSVLAEITVVMTAHISRRCPQINRSPLRVGRAKACPSWNHVSSGRPNLPQNAEPGQSSIVCGLFHHNIFGCILHRRAHRGWTKGKYAVPARGIALNAGAKRFGGTPAEPLNPLRAQPDDRKGSTHWRAPRRAARNRAKRAAHKRWPSRSAGQSTQSSRMQRDWARKSHSDLGQWKSFFGISSKIDRRHMEAAQARRDL
jgi:hypothetical protein